MSSRKFAVIVLMVGFFLFTGKMTVAQERSPVVTNFLKSFGLGIEDVREIAPDDILLLRKETDTALPILTLIIKFQDDDATCYVLASEAPSISCVNK